MSSPKTHDAEEPVESQVGAQLSVNLRKITKADRDYTLASSNWDGALADLKEVATAPLEKYAVTHAESA